MNPITVLLLLLAVCAQAADWKVVHLNANDPIREGGPIPIRLEITNPTSQPVEGRLECVIHVNDRPAAEHLSHPMVLIPGTQILSHLVPPIGKEHYSPQSGAHTVSLRFLGTASAIPLIKWTLPLTGHNRCVVAHVTNREVRFDDPEAGRIFDFTTPAAHLQKSLSLRSKDRTFSNSSLRFQNVLLTVEDVPSSPVALYAYDCLVLHPDTLRLFRNRQFEAIAQWVDSGGLLLLVASQNGDMSGLGGNDAAVGFLRRLSQDFPHLTWLRGAEGGFREFEAGPVLLHAGCGRVAILPSYSAFSEPVGSKVIGHLLSTKPSFWERWRRGENDYDLMRNNLEGALLPKAPMPLPASTIVKWMLGFVVLVVIGDYFFLGWLRRRKWTWVTFPVMSTVAAGGMLLFTQSRMNALEQSGTLRVVDLGNDGRILREARFVAVLPSQSRMGTTIHRQVTGFYYSAPRTWQIKDDDIRTEGSLSGTCSVHRPLTQWTTTFTYSFSPVGGSDDSGILWSKLNASKTLDENLANGIDPDRSYHFVFERNLDQNGRGSEYGGSDRYDNQLSTAGSRLSMHAHSETPVLPSTIDEFPPLPAQPSQDRKPTLVLALKKVGTEIVCYREQFYSDQKKPNTQ